MSNKLSRAQVLYKFKAVPKQHPGQANDVFIGELAGQTVAIRHARKTEASVDPFYRGVRVLFNAQPGNSSHYTNMYRLLAKHSMIPVPKLVSCFPYNDGTFSPMHEFVPGAAAKSFAEVDETGAFQYGIHLARLHSVHVSGYGTYGALLSKGTFHQQTTLTMKVLLRAFDYDTQTRNICMKYMRLLENLQEPTTFAPMMLDLDPTQYFVDKGRITVMIDIDFFAFGPPSLELAALEAIWPPHLAAPFVRGYQTVRPFPKLKDVRGPYRALNRLLCVQGDLPTEAWHDAPTLFDTNQHNV